MSAPAAIAAPDPGLTSEKFPKLLFFDGNCSFCNRWVYRVKEADHARHIRYGTKQGPTFQKVAQDHPELANVESVVLAVRRPDGHEDFLVRSAAIREVLKGLHGFGFFSFVLSVTPTFLSDIGYRIFSKLRTVLFSRWASCRMPLEEDRELYLD